MRLSFVMLLVSVLLCTVQPTSKGHKKGSRMAKLEKRLKKVEKSMKHCGCHKIKRDCPEGYMRLRGYCYRFFMGEQDKKNWPGAQEYCRSYGGNLVTINDRRKERFIHKFLQSNFRSGSEAGVRIYTGLIYTDSKATSPFDLSIGLRSGANSIRWTATAQAIIHPNVQYPLEPVSKWSPEIQGLNIGPDNSHLSCVVLVLKPSDNPASSSLVWRFNTCSTDALNFICEVKLPPRNAYRSGKQRQKRSSKTPERKSEEGVLQSEETDDNLLLESDDEEDDIRSHYYMNDNWGGGDTEEDDLEDDEDEEDGEDDEDS